jgi:hypothetical protein
MVRCFSVATVMLLSALSLAGQSTTELPPITRISLAERLWLAEIHSAGTEPSAGELRELARVCGQDGAASRPTAEPWLACRARVLKPSRYRILTLHAAPRATSPVVATLFEERSVGTYGYFQFTWTLERASRPGVRLAWPDAAQAFDYGLHIAGVQRRGDWVRLLDSIPVDGWLPVTPENNPGARPPYVRVSSLDTQLVGVGPLQATWPDGHRERTEGGPVLIQRITGDTIEFRDEIPSDFACGERVVDPVPLPPTLRAPLSALFNANGTPRFSETYTKGC